MGGTTFYVIVILMGKGRRARIQVTLALYSNDYSLAQPTVKTIQE